MVVSTGMGAWSLNTAFVERLAEEYNVDSILMFTDKIQAVAGAYCEQVEEVKEADLVAADSKRLIEDKK